MNLIKPYQETQTILNLQMPRICALKACSQNSLIFSSRLKGNKLFNELPLEIKDELSPLKFETKLKNTF